MISILIPVYNGVEFLKECLDSIKNQTFQDYEVIIGVNGHAVGSEVHQECMKHYSEKVRIIHISKVNSKVIALNIMVDKALYDLVALIDVDDKWLPEKLEKQMEYIEQGYDIVGTNTKYIGDRRGHANIPTGELKYENFVKDNPVIHSSVLMKKELCRWNVNFKSLEDYDLWARLIVAGYKFYNLPDLLTRNRIHKGSHFNKIDSEVYRKRIKCTYFKEK